MPIKSGGVAPVLLPAVAGMFMISLLDAAGMISPGSPLILAIFKVSLSIETQRAPACASKSAPAVVNTIPNTPIAALVMVVSGMPQRAL